MAPDDNSGARPAGPVVLRIKLRYDDLDAMVQRFASNVGKSGLFLPTKSIQPIGTEVKFELRLSNDTAVLVGLGRVKHVKHPDPNNPKASFGMAIELMRVSREGREVIIRMIERRRAMGLPDVAIPIPDDVESSRRAEVDTQPRAETSGVVRDAMAQLARHEPAAEPLLSTARPGSGPIAVARDESSERIAVPMLAPEKSRPRRPQVQELIDRAAELSSRIVLPTPELDIHVDVERVLTRARALAGGDLDVELSSLREAAATPIEISVEAASAELARQLGGKPIAKRDKSARWAPPPAIELRTELPPPAPDFEAKLRAETELGPSATIADAVQTAIESGVEAALQEAEIESESAPRHEPRADSPSVVPQESYVIRKSSELAAQRDAADYDEAFAQNASTTTAVDPAQIDPDTLPPKQFGVTSDVSTDVTTDPVEQHLMIDDDSDISSFERALDAARVHTGVSAPAPARPDDHELDDDGADELLASGEYQLDEAAAAESTVISVGPMPRYEAPPIPEQLAQQLDQQLAEAEAEAEREVAESMAQLPRYGEDVGRDKRDEREVADSMAQLPRYDEEEVSDLDVLAEADEEDEDLMGAAPAAYTPEPYQAAPEPVDDFAERLDLGDDDELPPPSDDIDPDAARAFDQDVPQPIHDDPHQPLPDDDREPPPEDYREPPASYGFQRARRASSEPSYTIAEDVRQSVPHFAPHATGEDFDEPHSYAPEPVVPRGPDPRLLQHGRPTTQSTEDLEDALAALDVGNIDVEAQRRMIRPAGRSPRPLPGLPVERPKTGPVPIAQPAPQRVAHTVPRSAARTTGQHEAQPQMLGKPPTGQLPVAGPAPAKSPTGQIGGRPKSPTAKPPPIPAAAMRPPTRQIPIVKPPTQQAPVVQTPIRAVTDDGVLIDFDEDE